MRHCLWRVDKTCLWRHGRKFRSAAHLMREPLVLGSGKNRTYLAILRPSAEYSFVSKQLTSVVEQVRWRLREMFGYDHMNTLPPVYVFNCFFELYTRLRTLPFVKRTIIGRVMSFFSAFSRWAIQISNNAVECILTEGDHCRLDRYVTILNRRSIVVQARWPRG